METSSAFQVQDLYPNTNPDNGGSRVPLLIVQGTSHKSIPLFISYRFPPAPALCYASKKATPLDHRIVHYNFKKHKKGPHPKGRGTRGTTFISSKAHFTASIKIPISNNDETFRQSLLCISVWSSEAHSLKVVHRFTPTTGSL